MSEKIGQLKLKLKHGKYCPTNVYNIEKIFRIIPLKKPYFTMAFSLLLKIVLDNFLK